MISIALCVICHCFRNFSAASLSVCLSVCVSVCLSLSLSLSMSLSVSQTDRQADLSVCVCLSLFVQCALIIFVHYNYSSING